VRLVRLDMAMTGREQAVEDLCNLYAAMTAHFITNREQASSDAQHMLHGLVISIGRLVIADPKGAGALGLYEVGRKHVEDWLLDSVIEVQQAQ
jgi:hypothetical protein